MDKESPAAVALRRATVADMAVCIELEKKVEGKTFSADTTTWGTLWHILRNVVFMIEVDGRAIGRISYKKKFGGSVYLSSLIIEPDY